MRIILVIEETYRLELLNWIIKAVTALSPLHRAFLFSSMSHFHVIPVIVNRSSKWISIVIRNSRSIGIGQHFPVLSPQTSLGRVRRTFLRKSRIQLATDKTNNVWWSRVRPIYVSSIWNNYKVYDYISGRVPALAAMARNRCTCEQFEDTWNFHHLSQQSRSRTF